MTSNPKAPEAMEWQQESEASRGEGEGEGAEGGDELSLASAPRVKTSVTHLSRTHGADPGLHSPGAGVGFLAKYRRR